MRNLVRWLVGVGWLLWIMICWCSSRSGELLAEETLDGVIHGDGSSCLGTARTQFGENPAMVGFSLQLGLLHAEIHLGQMMDDGLMKAGRTHGGGEMLHMGRRVSKGRRDAGSGLGGRRRICCSWT
ncbi:hypothetical protein ACLOJK_024272 [Asimina triloba]